MGDKDKNGEAATGNPREGEGQRRELQKIEVEKPMPRLSEADRSEDTRSLSRKMDRSLYLVLKNKQGRWRFPEDRIYGKENLHQVREAVMFLKPWQDLLTNSYRQPSAPCSKPAAST